MTRKDFRNLAGVRLADAKLLLDNGRYDGAYYLLGLAVECGLKACIARQTKQHEFPDKERAMQSYTHELTKLLKVAGLQTALDADMKLNTSLNANWLTVKDWSIESRYASIGQTKATDLNVAVNHKQHGVMKWIRQRW